MRTTKVFWLSLILINIFLLPNTLPPLEIGDLRFEWQLGDILIFATGFYLLIEILIRGRSTYFVSGITKLDKIAFVLLGVNIFSSIVAVVRWSSSSLFIFGCLLKSIEPYILYFFVRTKLRKEKEVSSIFQILILSTLILSLIGVIQILSVDVYKNIISFLFSHSRMLEEKGFTYFMSGGRISSLFINANTFGDFILVIWPFIFIRQALQMGAINKLFFLVFTTLLFLLLLYTQSREAWIGFIFIFVYMLYVGLRYKISSSFKSNIFLIGIIFAIAIVINYSTIYHRMIEYTFGGERFGFKYLYEVPDSQERFILWEATLKALPKSLFLGAGPIREDVKEFVPYYFITGGDPHNTFLRAFLETGFLGFIVFLFFIKELLSFGKLQLLHPYNNYKFSIVASTIGLIFSGFVGDSFQTFEVIVPLFIFSALLENVRKKGVSYENSSYK